MNVFGWTKVYQHSYSDNDWYLSQLPWISSMTPMLFALIFIFHQLQSYFCENKSCRFIKNWVKKCHHHLHKKTQKQWCSDSDSSKLHSVRLRALLEQQEQRFLSVFSNTPIFRVAFWRTSWWCGVHMYLFKDYFWITFGWTWSFGAHDPIWFFWIGWNQHSLLGKIIWEKQTKETMS